MNINIADRLKADFIDYILICVFSAIPVSLIFLFHLNSKPFYWALFMSVIFSLWICKDLINGKSIGKKITKLKVVKRDDLDASLWQLFLRNILVFMWPLDLFCIMITPEKKLGDIICGTKVVKNSIQLPLSNIKILASIGLFVTSIVVLFFIFYFLFAHSIFKLLFLS